MLNESKKQINSWAIFLISLIVFYLSFASLQQNLILNKTLDLEYYNADFLGFAEFCHNFTNHIPIKGKILSNSPSIFPDLFIHCSLNKFSSNIQFNLAFQYFIQLFLITITLGYIFNLFIKSKSLNSYTYSLLFFSLLFGLSSDFINTQYSEAILGVLQYHTGVFWLELLSFIFIVKLFTNFSNIQNGFIKALFYFLYTLTIILAVISDSLYLIQFIFPVTLILFYLHFTKSNYLKEKAFKNFCLITFTSLITASTINYKFVLPYSNLQNTLDSSHIFTKLDILSNIYFLIIKTSLAFHFLIFKIPLIVLLFAFIIPKLKNNSIILYSYWLIGFSITFLLIFLAGLFFPFGWTLRYFVPFIILPLFIYSYRFLSKHLLIALIACILLIKPMDSIKPYTQYTPPLLKCVQKINKEFKLYNGLSTYWESKPLFLFSKGKFNTFPLLENSPYFYEYYLEDKKPINFIIYKKCPPLKYCMQKTIYYKDYLTSYKPCFMPNLSCVKKEKLISQFGKPAHIFDCDSNYQIFVYNNNLKDKLQ